MFLQIKRGNTREKNRESIDGLNSIRSTNVSNLNPIQTCRKKGDELLGVGLYSALDVVKISRGR